MPAGCGVLVAGGDWPGVLVEGADKVTSLGGLTACAEKGASKVEVRLPYRSGVQMPL